MVCILKTYIVCIYIYIPCKQGPWSIWDLIELNKTLLILCVFLGHQARQHCTPASVCRETDRVAGGSGEDVGLRHTQSLPSVPSGCIISTWARDMRARPQACHLHAPFAPEFSTQQPLVVKIEGGQKQYLQLIWTAALVTRITALSCRHGRPALFVGPERMLSKIYVFLAVELCSKSALLLWKVKVPILTSFLSVSILFLSPHVLASPSENRRLPARQHLGESGRRLLRSSEVSSWTPIMPMSSKWCSNPIFWSWSETELFSPYLFLKQGLRQGSSIWFLCGIFSLISDGIFLKIFRCTAFFLWISCVNTTRSLRGC